MASLVTQPPSSSSAGQSNQDTTSGPAGNPPTALRSVKAASGFVYPAIWSFPPFFTLQPNPSTQAHQVSLWTRLILDWARYHKVYEVNVDGKGGAGAGSTLGASEEDVFVNKDIKRRLLPDSLRTILNQMVKEGRAVAEPPKQSDVFLLYWRKPEEWGTEIYDWVIGHGLGGSIMTLWEITEGELAESSEFYRLHPVILRKAIDSLVKRSKAQIIKGEGEAGQGVRFF